MKKIVWIFSALSAGVVGTLFVAGHASAYGPGSGGSATACTANYSDIDLASRSMSWGVYCPAGGHISVDAMVFYGSDPGVALPDAGYRYVAPGETWTVWSQDGTRNGSADHGVLHISQTMCDGPGCQLVLAHKMK